MTQSSLSTIANSAGFDFHYPLYAVGPHAKGSCTVLALCAPLKSCLTPRGLAIFAGSRSPETKTTRK